MILKCRSISFSYLIGVYIQLTKMKKLDQELWNICAHMLENQKLITLKVMIMRKEAESVII